MGPTQVAGALSVLAVAKEFNGASQTSLDRLAEHMICAELPPRSVLFEAGSVSDRVFLIENGHIRLTFGLASGREGMIAEMGPGELVGEMTAFTKKPRTATARTTTETVVWSMPADVLIDVVSSDPELAVSMMCATMDLVLEKDISVALTTDERAELQRAVDIEREAAQQLREHGAMKDEQVAIMAHDIRAPLTVILGCSEVLLKHWDALEATRREEFLATISRSAQALAGLVEDALQVSALESGETSYEIQSSDLVGLVRRIAEEFARGVPDRKIAIDSDVEELTVRCDERRQWQILTNLISNAVKFSEPETTVRVHVARDPAFGRVSVVDEGRGIPPESLRSLFRKFSRLPDPRGKRTSGTGLGLYICDLLVRGQGGEIWAESMPERGSTFTYTVPLA